MYQSSLLGSGLTIPGSALLDPARDFLLQADSFFRLGSFIPYIQALE